MKNSNRAVTYGGCGENRSTKIGLTYDLRATEGEENALVFYFSQGLCIESGVSFEGLAKGVSVFGKGRRVEDDKIVVIFRGVVKILKGVVDKSGVACVVREIEPDIVARHIDCFGGGVDGMNFHSAASQRVNAETACVAAHIEHVPIE